MIAQAAENLELGREILWQLKAHQEVHTMLEQQRSSSCPMFPFSVTQGESQAPLGPDTRAKPMFHHET